MPKEYVSLTSHFFHLAPCRLGRLGLAIERQGSLRWQRHVAEDTWTAWSWLGIRVYWWKCSRTEEELTARLHALFDRELSERVEAAAATNAEYHARAQKAESALREVLQVLDTVLDTLSEARGAIKAAYWCDSEQWEENKLRQKIDYTFFCAAKIRDAHPVASTKPSTPTAGLPDTSTEEATSTSQKGDLL